MKAHEKHQSPSPAWRRRTTDVMNDPDNRGNDE